MFSIEFENFKLKLYLYGKFGILFRKMQFSETISSHASCFQSFQLKLCSIDCENWKFYFLLALLFFLLVQYLRRVQKSADYVIQMKISACLASSFSCRLCAIQVPAWSLWIFLSEDEDLCGHSFCAHVRNQRKNQHVVCFKQNFQIS